MISLEQVVYVIPILGLTASILYYAMVIRNQNTIRKTQMLQRSLENLSNRETNDVWWEVYSLEWEDYDDFIQKYGRETNREMWAKCNAVWNEHNGHGYMLKQGIIELETVYDYGGGRPSWMWLKYEPILKRYIPNWNRFEWWEYLFNEMKSLSDQRGDTFFGIKPLDKKST